MKKNNKFFFFSNFRSELAERESMLRTKAMREKEEMKERRKYRFALMRIRFPDGLVLQVHRVKLPSAFILSIHISEYVFTRWPIQKLAKVLTLKRM